MSPVIPRTRAPELVGRGWLNTAAPLRLADLRGRFVLLDFWTFCCINCLHVIEELRTVEAAHHDRLVVVGVHSPKFAHEADPEALAQAVERYHVDHPVLDDPELRTWQAYAARAWPTLVLIDPDGYVVAQYAGEGHAHAISALIDELAPSYELAQGTADFFSPAARAETALRFPAKAVQLDDGGFVVADAGHDRLTVLAGDRATVTGRLAEGALNQPNGLCWLPAQVAAGLGYELVVADTGGHRLVGVGLDGSSTEIAASLNSPWDVAWWRDRLWVAMAGDHTLAAVDPSTGQVDHVGGTTTEGLLDGPLADAWFAQPSGLAADADALWLVDAETSALRRVEDGGDGLVVRTVVGEGLFDFGHVDGDRESARMQHPLGVALDGEGRVLVADTYNGAVRRFDPATGRLITVATGLAEPSGLLDTAAGLVVIESGAHRLTAIEPVETLVRPVSARTHRPVTDLVADVELRVRFTAPPGQKVDERYGPATQLQISATPPALLRSGDGVAPELVRRLVLDPAVEHGVLHVTARAATCDADGGEGAACRMHQQDWGIPVRMTTKGSGLLELPLGGSVS